MLDRLNWILKIFKKHEKEEAGQESEVQMFFCLRAEVDIDSKKCKTCKFSNITFYPDYMGGGISGKLCSNPEAIDFLKKYTETTGEYVDVKKCKFYVISDYAKEEREQKIKNKKGKEFYKNKNWWE